MYKFIGNHYPNITYTDQKFLVMHEIRVWYTTARPLFGAGRLSLAVQAPGTCAYTASVKLPAPNSGLATRDCRKDCSK